MKSQWVFNSEAGENSPDTSGDFPSYESFNGSFFCNNKKVALMIINNTDVL